MAAKKVPRRAHQDQPALPAPHVVAERLVAPLTMMEEALARLRGVEQAFELVLHCEPEPEPIELLHLLYDQLNAELKALNAAHEALHATWGGLLVRGLEAKIAAKAGA